MGQPSETGRSAPLREVAQVREGLTVWRERATPGGWIEGSGYYEILACGHAYVPYLNNRMGGQEEPKSPGARRRCDACRNGLVAPDWDALERMLQAARARFTQEHGAPNVLEPVRTSGRRGKRRVHWWMRLTSEEREALFAAFGNVPLATPDAAQTRDPARNRS